MKQRVKFFVIVASLWAIVALLVRLAIYYLPYPYDFKLLIFLINNPYVIHSVNAGLILAILLVLCFVYENIRGDVGGSDANDP